MRPAKTTVSVIIPTHNRVHSLRHLLDKLGAQTFPFELMEVIVVANCCTDSTISMLQNYQSPYKLCSSESSGDGPAVPRNKGASLATGSLLVFIDDDIDPPDGFLETHVQAHHNKKNAVVIGYLPLGTSIKADFFTIELKTLWEEKFQEMQIPGYRFSYTDMVSGNFSISADLFKKAKGFITGLQCRDDYELGIRLIKLGADFIFSKDAWAYHRGEVIDLFRSLKRKREEGKADVRLWSIHPDVIILPQPYNKRKTRFTFFFYNNAFILFSLLKMTDAIASCLKYLMFVFEKLQLRGKWKKLNYRLHRYWYFRGLFDQLRSQQALTQHFKNNPNPKIPIEELEIDLKAGLVGAIELLDQIRPNSVKLRYGMQIIGSIHTKPGTERLKGNHLRKILVTDFHESFIKSFALDKMMNDEHDTVEPRISENWIVSSK